MSIYTKNQKRHNHFAASNVNRCSSCGNFIAKPTKNGLNRVKCTNCGNWNHEYRKRKTATGD